MSSSAIMQDQLVFLRKKLVLGIDALGLNVSDQKIDQLLEYLQLFHKWNLAYNLSAVRKPEDMIHRHLLDSLSVVPHIKGDRFIDVGTGGGLPGIPLAIIFPEKTFTLLDSNGKKTRFLFQVKTSLQLDNVTVENRRVEAFQPDTGFCGVISRAFASIEDMLKGCHHLLSANGFFYAMKGQFPQDELSALEKHYKVVDSFALTVPESDGERHLIVLKNINN